jgi:signal transduction histidine kinase
MSAGYRETFMKSNDITKTIISPQYILNNLHSIFPDSVFLNRHFNILGVSLDLCTQLGYGLNELLGKPIYMLEQTGRLQNFLHDQLAGGHFADQSIEIFTRHGDSVRYSVSGFYMGLLTDNSDIIILRFNNKKELADLDEKLEKTRHQIDNFIYRSAHDLRGPLATMQGLLNLLKTRKDDGDVDNFIHLIDAHGKKLDERLGQLVYLAQVEEEFEQPSYDFKLSDFETSLREIIAKNAFVDFLELIIGPANVVVSGYNEVQITSMMGNLLLYILAIPRTASHNVILVSAKEVNNVLTIELRSHGFETDLTMEHDFNHINASRYVDVLQSSKFTHLFAAQKVAIQLHALVSLEMIDGETFEISATIPKSIARY